MNAVLWLIVCFISFVLLWTSGKLCFGFLLSGSISGFIATLLGVSIPYQILSIVLSLIIFLCFVFMGKNIGKTFETSKVKTNAESIIGQTVLVTQTIDNMKESGMVTVNGLEWTARSTDNHIIIDIGEHVIIESITGVKVIVRRK